MKLNFNANYTRYSTLVLLLGLSSLAPRAAFAASDACCGNPLSCFCFKAENGDWLKGGLIKVPQNAQTKGLQFKEVSFVLDSRRKTSDVKGKPHCGAGVWAGPDGTGGCTPGLPDFLK
jgi:hypothetical protein